MMAGWLYYPPVITGEAALTGIVNSGSTEAPSWRRRSNPAGHVTTGWKA